MEKGWILVSSCVLCGMLLVGGCLRSAMAHHVGAAGEPTITVTAGATHITTPRPTTTEKRTELLFEPMECHEVLPKQYTRIGDVFAFMDACGEIQYRAWGKLTVIKGEQKSSKVGMVAIKDGVPLTEELADMKREELSDPVPAEAKEVPDGYIHIKDNLYYFVSAGGLKHYRASASVNGKVMFFNSNESGSILPGALESDHQADKLLMASAGREVFVADAPYKTVIPSKTTLINMNNRLDPSYISSNLVAVSDYLDQAPFTLRDSDTYADREAMGAFILMVNAAKTEAGFESFYLCNVYRSYEKQKELWDYRVKASASYGRRPLVPMGSAYPGTSEHQSGFAFDIGTVKHKVLGTYLQNTPEHKWLAENSWRFGFIVRYQAHKSFLTGIKYEPYHFRYVGRELAEYLYKEDLCLEEYYDAPVVWLDTKAFATNE